MSQAAIGGVHVLPADADDWGPSIAVGIPVGAERIALRSRGSTGVLKAGVFRVTEPTPAPAEPYVIPGDETFIVLEGEVEIECEGETIRLKAGDMASFTTGQVTKWTIVKPFKKFFVVTEPD